MSIKPFRLEAVLFDFDGTLTHPGALDFSRIKSALGCPAELPILEYIESLPDIVQQKEAMTVLDRFEEKGAAHSRPNKGAEILVRNLKALDLKLGIITRNSRRSIELAFERFEGIGMSDFDLVISRDDPVSPKPSAEGVVLASRKLGVDVAQMMLVGDYIFDVQAGQNAGTVTVLLSNGSGQVDETADYTVEKLEDLEPLVRQGLPLQPGKLPHELLEQFLDEFTVADPSVLVKPGIGEDTAAIDLKGAEVLVLTSDPITFATDAIGLYAVAVNANDMATSGAVPAWLLTTLLFPAGVTPSEIGTTMQELHDACREWGITLCGGHTEITDAVSRPVVVGTMAGTVKKNGLIDKRSMKPGDRLLLTKGISVEGTAILAREFAGQLKDLGMGDGEVERCRNFLCHISILPEAKLAVDCGGVTSMHDITEGGLATAVEEMSAAGNCGIVVNMDAIPLFPETEQVCRLLELDPLGLIGSGSLLICCRQNGVDAMVSRMNEAGIAVTCIGEVVKGGVGVEGVKEGLPVPWPRFEVDEITRLF